MTQDDDSVVEHPEAYGIENPEAPGEPNRDALPPVPPVPGTGHAAREEHMRRHDEQGHPTPDADYRERLDREELKQVREEVDEADLDLPT